MITHTFEGRKDGLMAKFSKVSENGNRTGVRIALKSNMIVFDSFKVDKVDILSKATKLKKSLLSLDIEFSNDEIAQVVNCAQKALKVEIAQNDTERQNILYTIQGILNDIEGNNSEDSAYEDNGVLYINILSLTEILKPYHWKQLDFKRQLRDMGLLDISKGRCFDFKKNGSKVKETVDIWLLKVRLKDSDIDLSKTLTDMEDVA
jgi:hypothetical protein